MNKKNSKKEEVLYQSRTHWKILVKTFFIQLLIFTVYGLYFKFFPDRTNIDIVDQYGQWIVLAILFIPELLYVILPFLRWWNEKFTVTNYRIKNEWGILNKDSREIDLHRIVSISAEQSIVDRIFACGTLNFYDPAASSQPNSRGILTQHDIGNGIKFHDVPHVRHVKQVIENLRYNLDDDEIEN